MDVIKLRIWRWCDYPGLSRVGYIISGGLTSEGRGQEGQSQRDLKICAAADAYLEDGGRDPEPANACDAVSRSSPRAYRSRSWS